MKPEIIDSFLDQEEFEKLQIPFLPVSLLDWHYNPTVDDDGDVDKFQFIHVFFHQNPFKVSPFSNYLSPIVKKLGAISVLRIKANLLTRTSSIVENKFHVDFGNKEDGNVLSEEKLKQWTTAIFYMNTNNGYTKFEDGTKVASVANRIITFPSNMRHTGTSCTDEKIRVVINFNYFSK